VRKSTSNQFWESVVPNQLLPALKYSSLDNEISKIHAALCCIEIFMKKKSLSAKASSHFPSILASSVKIALDSAKFCSEQNFQAISVKGDIFAEVLRLCFHLFELLQSKPASSEYQIAIRVLSISLVSSSFDEINRVENWLEVKYEALKLANTIMRVNIEYIDLQEFVPIILKFSNENVDSIGDIGYKIKELVLSIIQTLWASHPNKLTHLSQSIIDELTKFTCPALPVEVWKLIFGRKSFLL